MSSVRCPNCYRELFVQSSSSFTTTCTACEMRVVVESSVPQAKTQMALITQPPVGLAVGWPVELNGQPILVHGRVQYRYEAGLWDEYHVELPDRDFAWISVDEGQYSLMREIEVEIDLAKLKKLDAGNFFSIQGQRFQVREIGFATMVGMQGSLPFIVEPDEVMHYIELKGEQKQITVEIFRDESHLIFEGQRFDAADLKQMGFAPDSRSPFQKIYSPPIFDDLQIADSSAVAPKSTNCPECGVTIAPTSAKTALMVCQACRAGLNISNSDRPKRMFKTPKQGIRLPVNLGHECNFAGVQYRIAGRVRYRQKSKDGTYYWTACQLIPITPGSSEPIFLEYESGHWTLFRNCEPPIDEHPGGYRLTPIELDGSTYNFAEQGRCEIVAIDGELTWLPNIGDSLHFTDLVCPPFVLSAEWNKNEMEWSVGKYLHRSEVARAFGLTTWDLDQPEHYLAHQPFHSTINHKICFWTAMILGSLMVWMAIQASNVAGERIFSDKVQAKDYLSGQGYISQPIEIPAGVHVCKLSAASNGLNNQWVSFSFLFLDENEKVLLDEDSIVEQYNGPGWSEGSHSTYRLIKLKGPRNYRINLFGESGVWSQRGGDQIVRTGPAIDIWLDRGVRPAKGWAWGAVIAFLYPVIRIFRRFGFESAKAEWLSED